MMSRDGPHGTKTGEPAAPTKSHEKGFGLIVHGVAERDHAEPTGHAGLREGLIARLPREGLERAARTPVNLQNEGFEAEPLAQAAHGLALIGSVRPQPMVDGEEDERPLWTRLAQENGEGDRVGAAGNGEASRPRRGVERSKVEGWSDARFKGVLARGLGGRNAASELLGALGSRREPAQTQPAARCCASPSERSAGSTSGKRPKSSSSDEQAASRSPNPFSAVPSPTRLFGARVPSGLVV